MNQVGGALEFTGSIASFPSIDRYFPACWCASAEAIAKFRFGISDFGKVYGKHSFAYNKSPGPIRYRDNEVELDLEIHRAPLTLEELQASIEDIYGIRAVVRRFNHLEEYWEYCKKELSNGIPVFTDFDIAFIKVRREYGKVFTPHVIILRGYQPQDRTILATEQMVGDLTVEFSDLMRFFERRLATDGSICTWELVRDGQSERELLPEEVLVQIQANLHNLTSTDCGLGLKGLILFRQDLEEYLSSTAFRGRPFAVPGLWVFSHERHIERKWLKAIQYIYPQDTLALFDEFDVVLSKLFKSWLNADYLLEKCLVSGNGKPLRAFPTYLDEILRLEIRALELWEELRRLF